MAMDGGLHFGNPEDCNPCELRQLAQELPGAIRTELGFGPNNTGILYIKGERRYATVPDERKILEYIRVEHRLESPGAVQLCVRIDVPLRYKMGQQDVHTMRMEISVEMLPLLDAEILEDPPSNAMDTIRSAIAAGAVTIAGVLSLAAVTYGILRSREDIQKLIDNICQILPQCPF